MGFTNTLLFCVERFSGIHRCSFSCLIYVPRSACGSDLFQETPFEYAEGGHGGSGTQGTLWSLQIWGPFFFLSPRLSESWKPCPARCLETWLLPVSHPAVAFGYRVVSLGLELDLECFRTPVEKNRKLAMEIELPHPSRHLRTLYTLLPLMPKHRGMTWNLSMCLTDVGSFLSDLTKPSLATDVLSTVFSFMCETKQTRELDDLDRCLFHCISDTRLCS